MRLLFISNLYPPLERGGYEQNCQEIAVRLQQRGHQVTVLASQHSPDLPRDEMTKRVIRAIENPNVDILLIEPTRDDLRMFGYHIMRYGARRVVAEHGYRTAFEYFRTNEKRCRRLFARHGVPMADPHCVPDVPPRHAHRSGLARALDASLDRLESRMGSRARLARCG